MAIYRAFTILARPAGAMVCTSRGAIWAGSHHKWEDQIHHIATQLDYWYAAEVEDVITSPLGTGALSDTEDGVSAAVVHFSLPTCSPTLLRSRRWVGQNIQFLRHLKSLAPDVPDEFLRSIWSSWLPSDSQAVLAGQAEDNLASAPNLADRISEVTHQPTTASVDNILEEFPDLTKPTGIHARYETTPFITSGQPQVPRNLSTALASFWPSCESQCRVRRHVARWHRSALKGILVFNLSYNAQKRQ
jgi:hypothetical protein